MLTLTIYQAAQVNYAPSRVYLSRLAKKENRPVYFVKDGDSWAVNVEHPDWLSLLKTREKKEQGKPSSPSQKAKSPKTSRKPAKGKILSPPAAPSDNTGKKIAELKWQKLEAEVKEKEIKNEINYLEMQKKSGNIIDFDLANYLFFSFMEKANVDFLRAAKKNEARIDNFVKEGKTREIVKLFENEATAILKEIVKSQKLSLEKWKDEEGIK